ncbi:N-acetyltransferase [Phormidium sp. LEGE 05292]|uniref:GNAT family N-acetyltransferase n=1 Tax=[Phormidium] sp. LEGE 05292 TaxID=767427 RepID=UPI0018818742|nr:N-acetyltransferase [Phormidium sp. LEGE 05292]MBE9226585.1 N-acetyltransferase [Phormidium sp. LEGE 05292]
MLTFASETENDIAAIREVLITAFDRTNEAKLVDLIRNSENFIPELSIVAKEDNLVLGHILFSPISIDTTSENISALALAPLAVTPAHQRQGIGSQLIEIGLAKCQELGHSIVVVLGHPNYYAKFGFQTASKFGVAAPFSVPDEAFMILELKPDALHNVNGTVRYPAYFNEV